MRKFFILVNPIAGGGKSLKMHRQLIERMQADGLSWESLETSPDQDLKRLLDDKLDQGISDLVIIGGDGTLNAVINALPNFGFPITYFPGGTGNDFARIFGKAPSFDALYNCMLRSFPGLIDLGECNGVYFHNGIGIGFDGAVAHTAAKYRGKLILNQFSYWLAVLSEIFSYGHHQIQLEFDGKKLDLEAFLLCAGNGKSFGGGFKLCPMASVLDGRLDICHIKPINLLGRLRRLPYVPYGKHVHMKDVVSMLSAQNITVRSDSPLQAHIDGELLEESEFRIKVHPSLLRLRYPGLS